MTMRDVPFSPDDWYHCFNITIEKRPAFVDTIDYQRFLEILYLANDSSPLRRGDIGSWSFEEVFRFPRENRLVAIGAFCLTQSYFHLVLRESEAGGITTFMRKVGTAYTMYFNARHTRAGNLFLKPFRSRQVPLSHLERAVSYVHCSAALLYEPDWKKRHVVDPQFLEERLLAYPYSSMRAYAGTRTPAVAILDAKTLSEGRNLPIQRLLKEALAYCDPDIP